MVCLETDFLVSFIRQKADAVEKMKSVVGLGKELCITPITATELFVGAFASRQPRDFDKLEELLSTFRVLEFDLAAAKTAGRILFELSKKGAAIGDMDSITAAIAIRHNHCLITRNKKHFSRISSLKTESW